MKKKILVIFGTRPEAIKMAPVVLKLRKSEDIFETRVCVTAQHREMLDQVLKIFDIEPDYDLDIMKSNQDLYDITSRVLLEIRDVLNDFHPDLAMVHGDTTSSAIGALAAFYQQIPVAHVEAGLRTGNIYSPWPEEFNRKLTGAITTWHFAPTETSKNNLLAENVNSEKIFVTGNTVIDALVIVSEKIKSSGEIEKRILESLKEAFNSDPSGILSKKFILVTGHRRENFGRGFIQICEALKEIALEYPDVNIIYPVHLNPNVQKPVYNLLKETRNIYLIPPLSYLPFIYLMGKSYFVLTDSGGIQEEAPGLGKPVLVMRGTTERPEAVDAGTVKLVGTDKKVILEETRKLIEDITEFERMAKAHNPYGDGHAAERITEILKRNI